MNQFPDPVHGAFRAILSYTNHSAITAVHTRQRSWESFSDEKSIHAFEKSKTLFTKRHWTHCLNAVPDN